MMLRHESLEALARRRTNQVVVGAYGAGRDFRAIAPSLLNLCEVGTMGMASSIGLGIAIGRPERQVWILDGDGSLVMNVGSLISIASAAPPNLVHFVFVNRIYEASGGQPVVGIDKLSFAAFAQAAGFPRVYEFENVTELDRQLDDVLAGKGPTFVVMHAIAGKKLPAGRDVTNLEEWLRVRRTLERG